MKKYQWWTNSTDITSSIICPFCHQGVHLDVIWLERWLEWLRRSKWKSIAPSQRMQGHCQSSWQGPLQSKPDTLEHITTPLSTSPPSIITVPQKVKDPSRSGSRSATLGANYFIIIFQIHLSTMCGQAENTPHFMNLHLSPANETSGGSHRCEGT